MVIKDLKQTCGQCHGSGRQAGVSQWGVTQINPGGLCHPCGGRGFVLTPLGRELVELLRPFVEEMIAVQRAAQPKAPKPELD
jgi:hypothetical protein